MELLPFLRAQVRANRLANRRLHAAMAPLSAPELQAPRTSFFPSLIATLDHILWVDRYYLDCLSGHADAHARAREWQPYRALSALSAAQVASDERFIALLEALAPGDLERVVELPRGDAGVQREPLASVVAHLLNHQVHHRGQVHAMLAGTAVAPPQLDEFLMRSEAELRAGDLAALGWTEERLFA